MLQTTISELCFAFWIKERCPSCKDPFASKSYILISLSSKPISGNNFRAEIDKALLDINVLGAPMPGIKYSSGSNIIVPSEVFIESAIPISSK